MGKRVYDLFKIQKVVSLVESMGYTILRRLLFGVFIF